ncbi:discoidin domain-containing protein [Brevundimonas subvibrioides]|uniref:discoidin domain-containing protein n=1 Tax=Brevundimonas subvibrioides TaxID=74313 RepID=UPI0032D58897
MRVLFGLVVALVCSVPAQAQSSRALDTFEDLTAWSADASTDVTSTLSSVPGHRGDALRLDYDFNGRSGYAFAARDLSFEVPENYEISFWVRGTGPTNTFEVKFTDASGENVHWRQTTRYAFPDGWTLFTIKKRQVAWAWGPKPDRTFRGAERVEFVVTAGEGGRGFIEIDDLSLRTLPPEPSVPPRPLVEATSAAGNAVAALSVDEDPLTAWVSAEGGEQALTLDLGYEREFGGLTLRWAIGQAASRYRVMASSDRRQWREIARVTDGDGGTDWLMTTEASARWLRLDLQQPLRPRDGSGQMGAGLGTSGPAQSVYGLTDLRVEPLAFGKDATAFLTAVAGQSRRGHYPRGIRWRAALLDPGRGGRRRRERPHLRGRGHRAEARRAVDRAVRAGQRPAGRLGGRPDRAGPDRGRPADPGGELGPRRLDAEGHGDGGGSTRRGIALWPV